MSYSNSASNVGFSWEHSELGPAVSLITISHRESALQMCEDKIQLL